jgi:hypothetical protein
LANLLARLQLPDPVVLTTAYYTLVETHLRYFRQHPKTAVAIAQGHVAERYTGDFYGLLNSLSIKKNHYLIMRVNGLYSSTDYDGRVLEIRIPDEPTVARILTRHKSIEN